MSLDKLKEYFEIFTACWKFFRKYVELIKKVDNDSYWEALVDENVEIYERYGNTEFVKGLLVATTKEIERIYENEKGEK